MLGNRALTLCAVLGLAVAAVATAQEQPSRFTPADATAISIELAGGPEDYSAAGNGLADLETTAGCSDSRPRGIDVALRWTVEGAGVDQLRVDITKFGRGFANGEFLTSGALPSSEQEAFFADAEPGIYYYWRLLARGVDTWTVAANGRFEAPICPFDEVAE